MIMAKSGTGPGLRLGYRTRVKAVIGPGFRLGQDQG